jgi:tetratricopeptide (TPR) repeat protein
MDKIKWIEDYIEEALKLIWLEGYEPALKILQRLLYEEPGYARLHNTLGVIFFNHAEDLKNAEIHFRMAIKFDKKLAEPYWHLGALLQQEERWDEAIEICSLGLKAKKSNKSGLLSSVGQAYELKKKYRQAISHYKEALSHSAELWDCRVLEENIKRCKRKRSNR